MALTPHCLRVLAPYLRGADVLSFGYPDLLMSPAEASGILGVKLYGESEFGAAHKIDRPIANTADAFRAMGATMRAVDVVPSRGVELVFDLNAALPWTGFDLVIDAGTIEHCANIGQALMNAADAVRPGGHVFHAPPLSMANHGFYNVNPTLLVDFYEQNGWGVKHLSAFSAKPPYESFEVPAHARFKAPPDACLCFVAQRTSSERSAWPTQWKYLQKGKE